MKKKNRLTKKYVFGIIALVVLVFCYCCYAVFGETVYVHEEVESVDFAISTGSTVDEVCVKLNDNQLIHYKLGLKICILFMDLKNHVYPGMYEVKNGISNFDLIRLFRSGKRKTVNLTIQFARHYDEVLLLASQKLEASYNELMELTNNQFYMDSLGFSKPNRICLFLPDTYEFYWNTSARQFLERMAKEYDKYWNENRCKKAQSVGLTPQEVMTLASIVDQETTQNGDKPRIAGVYINRLRGRETAGKLQADPTIKFALNDFSIKRIRKGHIEKAQSSPYSTYANRGLPPGPICIASKQGIDAVLNYAHHNFYYFCAKPDYSGYSNFSTTFAEHRKNAIEYQKWLTKEGY